MKIQYKSLFSSCCWLFTLGLVASCASNLSYNEAMQKNISEIDDSEKLEDARFLLEAASYNLLATRMAETAIESGYSSSVVSMARENLEKHAEMARELRRLARKGDIVLPGEMSSEDERMLAELASADRREFDKTYLRLLREIGEEDSQMFSEMAIQAESEDIRAFAARKLDMFESYREQIQTVDAELLQTY